MFDLQDVLERKGIAAQDVHVMLHSPKEPKLAAVLPALVKTNRAAMEAYQATHPARAEGTLRQGRPWVMAFVKVAQDVPSSHSLMLFAGMYRNAGNRRRRNSEIMAEPSVALLWEAYGIYGDSAAANPRGFSTWFDLVLDPLLEELQGRLVVSIALTPTYLRRAENLEAKVKAIHQESLFDADPPDWRSWTLSAAEMRALPPGWAARLREWRGVYLIVDERDGARYVGSASGKENLLGRWSAHVATDRGATVGMQDRDPKTFRFSILERMSPDMERDEVSRREQIWMERLHTVAFGLNRPGRAPDGA